MKNNEYRTKAHYFIPGGAHTYSRGDDQYPSNAPSVLSRGKGCYVWDMEENKFLDYGMGLRSVTIGYSNEDINTAAVDAIKKGNSLTRASQIEIDAAEKLCNLIPSAEMVKFAKNGSTVTTAAVKLARSYTGRKFIARCSEQPFFSYDDWFIGNTVVNKGIPEEVKGLTLGFSYNSIESLEKLSQEYKDEIACVILEPATYIEPENNFLQDVQDLCKREGIVFILDEMITGFRWDLKGAQHMYGVTPDLTTFGKGMANGFSVAALVGKREIMELGSIKNIGMERTFLISTTHGAEMCGLNAFIATIDFYKKHNVIEHMWEYGRKLKSGMNKISEELGLKKYFRVEGIPISPVYFCFDLNMDISLKFKTLFMSEMIKRGILMPWISLSFSHGEIELDMTLEAVKDSLIIYKKVLSEGNIDDYIDQPVKPVFRKYN